MGPLEDELRRQRLYHLSDIPSIRDAWLEALDREDPSVIEGMQWSPKDIEIFRWRSIRFADEAILRLAREIDELKESRDK
jgi:hypothetical protein